MAKEVKYPVGEQDFKMLREADCIYVDKIIVYMLIR